MSVCERLAAMRVLYVAGATFIGGAETHLLSVLKHGRQREIEPVGVLLPGKGMLHQRVLELGLPTGLIDYYGLSLPNPFRYFQTLRQLRSWVLGARPDVVHVTHHCIAEFAYRLKQLSHRPVICDLPGLESDVFMRRNRRWLMGVDCVTVPSQAVMHHIEKWLHPADIRVIHDGIEIERFFGEKRRSQSFRREFGIPLDCPVVGIVGRVVPEKGIEEFIRAARMILQEMPGVWFAIVGGDGKGGKLIQEYTSFAAELSVSDRLVFTGFCDDVPVALSALDVFVLASWMDAFPNSVIEAMAAGVPVVATAVGGVPEMIRSGENGFLVPPKDPVALAEGIMRVLRLSPAERGALVSKASQTTFERFDIRNQVQELASLYASLMTSAGKAPFTYVGTAAP